MMTDPIADMLTRMRNGMTINRLHVDIPASRIKESIAAILQKEGFIRSYEKQNDPPQGTLRVHLKYGPDGEKVIHLLQRVSRPSRRVYRTVRTMKNVRKGLGIYIVSTSKGLLTDHQCRQQKIGGELVCVVW